MEIQFTIFFDGINVDEHVRIIFDDYSNVRLVQHQELIFKSNANGQIKGDFLIFNNSQQRLLTGEVQFRLTTSKNNEIGPASRLSSMQHAPAKVCYKLN